MLVHFVTLYNLMELAMRLLAKKEVTLECHQNKCHLLPLFVMHTYHLQYVPVWSVRPVAQLALNQVYSTDAFCCACKFSLSFQK